MQIRPCKLSHWLVGQSDFFLSGVWGGLFKSYNQSSKAFCSTSPYSFWSSLKSNHRSRCLVIAEPGVKDKEQLSWEWSHLGNCISCYIYYWVGYTDKFWRLFHLTLYSQESSLSWLQEDLAQLALVLAFRFSKKINFMICRIKLKDHSVKHPRK